MKARAQGLSLRAPHCSATSRLGPTPTWQVQVESQKQVHAEIRQLLCGVRGQPILHNAQQELGEGCAQVLWERGTQSLQACSSPPHHPASLEIPYPCQATVSGSPGPRAMGPSWLRAPHSKLASNQPPYHSVRRALPPPWRRPWPG